MKAAIFLCLLTILTACGTTGPIPIVAHMPSRAASACQVNAVTNGNVVRAQCDDGPEVAVRFLHYDTPGRLEPQCRAEARAAKEAQAYLAGLLQNGKIIVPKLHGRDRHDHVLATLEIDDVHLHDLMIESGLAAPYAGGPRIDWCARLRK